MEIYHLKCFTVLAEHLSFMSASQELFVEPSTLSKTISKMEQELNVQLFDRTTHNVKLTAAGESFRADAKLILSEYDSALGRLSAVANGKNGHLKVGYLDAMEHFIVPMASRELKKEFPNIEIRLSRCDWKELFNPQSLGMNDVSVFFQFKGLDMTGLDYREIRPFKYYAIIPDNHPLASRGSVCIDDLKGEVFSFVGKDMNRSIFDGEIEHIFQNRFRPYVKYDEGNVNEILANVSAGFCMSAAPIITKREYPGVAYVPIVDTPPKMLIAVWSKDNRNPLISPFVEKISIISRSWA